MPKSRECGNNILLSGPNLVQLVYHTTDTVARMRARCCGFPRFHRSVPGGAPCAPVHGVNDFFSFPPLAHFYNNRFTCKTCLLNFKCLTYSLRALYL